tara:strand:- start:144 stop:425 length:282 start_codon:yes stop_codon:yes gene_type:complete
LSLNKPWKNESFHQSFDLADTKRKKLLNIWEGNDSHKGMQVKVKFLASKDMFVVKTRLHPDFDIKKENKKNGKGKRRNKKNSNDGKFDPSASV